MDVQARLCSQAHRDQASNCDKGAEAEPELKQPKRGLHALLQVVT